MGNDWIARRRRRIGYVLLTIPPLVLAWWLTPSLPLFWGPTASTEAKAAGNDLFQHQWQPGDPLAGGDGLGPVFNAQSCVACHFQGGVGGGGSNQFNVTTFTVLPTRGGEMKQGVIHAAATRPAFRESADRLHRLFPAVTGAITSQVVDGCRVETHSQDFDPVRTEQVNTTALFGAGWIDYISDRKIKNNRIRNTLANVVEEFNLNFDTIPAGRPRILPDGRVGKFGWKGQFATLKEFVAAACANELGLGTALMAQPAPLGQTADPTVRPDLDSRQFGQLVAFVRTLPRPVEMESDDPKQCEHAARGKHLFRAIGCAVCHIPDMGGVKGVYSDFLLHTLQDSNGNNGGGYGSLPPGTELPESEPLPDEWKTPPLWGVADSAPYLHDGAAATLRDAILHHRGDARPVTRIYEKLDQSDQQAVVAFLRTLKAPPEAEPAPRR
jgi:mono/diheme cytochrome c family protein